VLVNRTWLFLGSFQRCVAKLALNLHCKEEKRDNDKQQPLELKVRFHAFQVFGLFRMDHFHDTIVRLALAPRRPRVHSNPRLHHGHTRTGSRTIRSSNEKLAKGCIVIQT
jgi:hypothetical protein